MARLETATKAGFAVLLLGLSLLLAFGLQPGSKPAAVTTVVQTVNSPEGAILVLVEVSDGEGGHSPGVGVGVGITQLQVGGIRATLQTNHTGQAWFPAPAGSYGVGVSDPRFAVSGKANVTGGRTTLFFVEVNRTAYGVGFADVKEVSQGGGVLPTGRIDLEVGQEVTFVSLGGGGGYLVASPGGSQTTPRFNGTVFLQGVECCNENGLATLGQEVPSAVLYQGTRGGLPWMEVGPTKPFSVGGVEEFLLVAYRAGYSVEYLGS